MKISTQQRVDENFQRYLKRLYPTKSFREATNSLNRVLEDMLYGKKNKK